MLSYAPIGAMGAGGGRRNWVVGLADGRILVYSPYGDELARHATGARIQAILVFPQPGGPDFLVTATRRGLTALRPALRAWFQGVALAYLLLRFLRLVRFL